LTKQNSYTPSDSTYGTTYHTVTCSRYCDHDLHGSTAAQTLFFSLYGKLRPSKPLGAKRRHGNISTCIQEKAASLHHHNISVDADKVNGVNVHSV